MTALFIAQGLLFVHPSFAKCNLRQIVSHHFKLFKPRTYQTNFGPTVGIEIEGWVDKGVGRDGLGKKVKKILEQRYPGVKVHYRHLPTSTSIYYLKNGHVYEYEFVRDGSVKLPGWAQDVELRSPILRSSEDLEDYKQVIQGLHEVGFTAEPLSSGVHVHVGFEEASGPEAASLFSVFQSVENQLLDVFHVKGPRRTYAKPLTSTKYIVDLDQAPSQFSVEQFIESIKPRLGDFLGGSAHDPRHRTLNLLPILEHKKTVELRLFNSTLDPAAVELMVEFSRNLVKAIRTQDETFLKYLEGLEKNKPSLTEMAKVLGVDFSSKHEVIEGLRKQFDEAKKLNKSKAFLQPGIPSNAELTELGSFLTPASAKVEVKISRGRALYNAITEHPFLSLFVGTGIAFPISYLADEYNQPLNKDTNSKKDSPTPHKP